MNLANRPEHAGVDPFLGEAGALVGVPLIAHLGDDPVLQRGGLEEARFLDRVRQGFLHVDVLAHFNRHERDWKMHVIGRGHRDCIDAVAHFREHLPVVAITCRLRQLRERALARDKIDVAQRDDVLAEAGHGIAIAFAP